MRNHPSTDPARYRTLALDAYRDADALQDAEEKYILRQIAFAYDRLAEHVQSRDKAAEPSRQRNK